MNYFIAQFCSAKPSLLSGIEVEFRAILPY